MSTQYTSTPPLSPSTLLPYPHTLPQLEKPYTGEYGAAMTHLQIGDLYTHWKQPDRIHILHEISKSCVHLLNLAQGTERTIRNDIFKRMWVRVGDNQ